MNIKNNNGVIQPKPFEKGFGVKPVHDKPIPEAKNINSNFNNGNKKQQGK
jgi:hypothetical protein